MASASTPSRKANGLAPTNGPGDGSKKAKAAASGTKVQVHRLPPGMNAQEFWSILGTEWEVGNGKIDWARFDPGKISSNPLKLSTPGVCSLRILKVDDIQDLANVVEKAIWEDAKNSFNDPCLIRRPYLEVAIYQKIATPKPRPDPRQGTIEQDPEYQEFMAALEGNQSAPKDATGDQDQPTLDEANKENVKVTTTPLIEYLKEKKANKAKEVASAKSAKHTRNESQGGKTKASDDSKKKGRESKSERADKAKEKEKEKEKPTEQVKLLTKKGAQEATEGAKSTASHNSSGKTGEAAPKTRRAGIAAVAKQLQRDLGLSPGSAHRRARMDAAKAEAVAKPDASSTSNSVEKDAKIVKESKDPETSKSVPTGPKSQAAEGSRRSRGKAKASTTQMTTDPGKGKAADSPAKPTTGPIVLLKKEATKKPETAPTRPASPLTPTALSSTPASTINPPPPTGPKAVTGKASTSTKSNTSAPPKKGVAEPTPGSTRAFVKHANPSQGVTEALLKQAMEVFGQVTFIEIDKRKGFAYVDFSDDSGLRKAMAASPVAVARGTVQVLERKKDKKAATPAPSQPATNDSTTGDTSSAPSDRPKRGGRGRGRRGGGNAATPSASGANDETQTSLPVPTPPTE